MTIEQNYRSTAPILDAANAVIALAPARAPREEPVARRAPAARARCSPPSPTSWRRSTYVVERILERREAGVPLRQQAVLFRTAHHSDALEVELGRRNIPFVKFGGLRFLEAAHVKDALACLRWAENPRDSLAGFRVAQLLPGMGPRLADALVRHLAGARFALPPALASFDPPAAARADWPAFAELFARLCDAAAPWAAHMGLVRRWYEPHLDAPLRRRARAPRRSRAAGAARGGGAVARALPVRADAGSAGRRPAPRRARRTSTRTT